MAAPGTGTDSTVALEESLTNATSGTNAFLTKTIAGLATNNSNMTLDFDVNIVSAQTNASYVELAAIRVDNIEYGLRLRTGTCPGGATFCFDRTSPKTNTNTTGVAVTLDTWTHVTIVLTRPAGGGYVGALTVGGTAIDTANNNPFDSQSPNQASPVDIAIGMFAAQGTVEAQFDNIVVK